jgi:hypothetical protein
VVKGEWWRGVNSSMIYCKNFCKCHSALPPRTTIKKRRNILHEKEKPAIKFPIIVPRAQLLRRQRWTEPQFEVKLGVVS